MILRVVNNIMKKGNYTKKNSFQWDKWANDNCIWTMPISHEEYVNACKGEYSIYLTPTKPLPREWLGELSSSCVLGLASAGGQQIPLLASQGAKVTVLDISKRQLESERIVAEREKYSVNLVQGDFSKPLPFENNTFDLIINPVSNSYLQDILPLWKECARVLKSGGTLLSGFANPVVYMFDVLENELTVRNKLPLNPLVDYPDDVLEKIVNKDGVQFSHTLSDQIDGQLQAGLRIMNFFEDSHPKSEDTNYDTYIGAIASRLTHYMPIYCATRSIKI